METEIPAMLTSRYSLFPEEHFTFHSSRMRMMHVSPEELKKMDIDSDRCALELSDARVDVMAYACLVAIMCQGCRLSQSLPGTAGQDRRRQPVERPGAQFRRCTDRQA